MVRSCVLIPSYLINHLYILRHVGVQVVLDDLLDTVIGVEFEEHHEVDVVSSGRVQYSNILDADDGGHTFVSADTQHAKDFFTELHTGHHIIEDGKEVVFVRSVLVDIFHVFEDFRKILTGLNQMLHRLVDSCLW